MKVLAVLLVVVIVGVALLVKFGGVTDFDPAAGADEFISQVQPGMSWQQVVDIRPPKKFAAFSNNPNRLHGPIVKFDEAAFATKIQNGSYNLGFFFEYRFDAENAYNVNFDEQGNVTSVEELMTMSDLLGG
ncbi:hypothetical protein HNQ40_003072 [Algisphaera agarilytica]|uniref:Uncharacterized protein n=2 Tax=Algisphaera agarilytica TaxID=1385975 RepID=A0A7X0LM44_9BACT|nr:hypothetical protein [Algisphaera agarilytica]